MFTTKRQDDWANLLSMAKFAYNNVCHSATGFSLFYATYRYHPILSFTKPMTSMVTTTAKDRIQNLQQVHEEVKTMISIVGK